MGYLSATRQRRYQREWVARRRSGYIARHGGCCSRCGATEQLEFDHVDPTTKIDHKVWSWSRERLEAELAKCQLLCRACHLAKTMQERGYQPRPHGTNLKYVKDACRCGACRSAHAATAAAYRARTGRSLRAA